MPERIIQPYEERSFIAPAILSIAVVIAVGVGAYYFYFSNSQPQYRSVLTELDASSLPVSFERILAAQRPLDQLKREPCDREAIIPLAELMTKSGYPRESAKSAIKFSERCGPSVELFQLAYEALDRLGDFKGAVNIANEMIKLDQANPDYRFWRGQSHENLKNYKAALSDYVSTLQLFRNLSRVSLSQFYEVSRMYAAIGRPCDAITPLEMYLSYDVARRQTAQITKLISEYAIQGDCRAQHAAGSDKIILPPNNIVEVVVNGVRGRMVLDTGATMVAITPSFASRAKIIPDDQNMMTVGVVGGTIQSAPGYASVIQVGKTSAANVPVAVSTGRDDAYGPDIDGLLGMTFLARFVLTISSGTVELKPRTL
ncbi:MAG: retropepsin-like aspartic protease [Alphaproteobacteria bacterium]|nr:retropepsin-like aspartic protease [Alphaproteobacteria bacterium]